MRECGSCSMCCRVLPIPSPEEIKKPGNVWCKHWSKKTKCSIYDSRPEVCKKFFCDWISNDALPDEVRPDKSKVILKYNEQGKLIVVVSDQDPQAWQKGLMGAILREYENAYSVYCGGIKLAEVHSKNEH